MTMYYETSEPASQAAEFRPTSLETKDALVQVARYWVKKYGGEGLTFNADQEYRLASEIQSGLIAERITDGKDDIETAILSTIERAQAAQLTLSRDADAAAIDKLTKTQSDELLETVREGEVARALITSGMSAQKAVANTIKAGENAQAALVETNLRFAHFFARESVGIHHEGSLRRMRENGAKHAEAHPEKAGLKSGRSYSDGKSGFVGTYRPLKSSKSIYASLDDRKTYATIGIMKAAKHFRPTPPVNGQGNGKFISYAAWSVQQEIQRMSENEEHNGVRLPSHQHQEINTHFWKTPTLLEGVPIPENVAKLVTIADYEEFPSTLAENYEGSLDDINDPYGEDDHAETFSDVYVDPRKDVIESVERRMSREILKNLLFSLSERESGVIAKRFGFPLDEDHDEDSMMTLDEIADTYGVTRERIRQIESKTMAKIRHPERSKYVRDFVDIGVTSNFPSDFVSRGDQVKLPLGAATYNGPQTHEAPISEVHAPFTPLERLEREEKQAWQLDLRESWETPVRRFPEPAPEFVDPELFQFIYKVIDAADNYHFQKSFADSTNTPYPAGLVRRIDAYCEGKIMTPGQITSIWTRFMRSGYPRIKQELGDDFSGDRVGQFFSKLIETHVNTSDNSERMTLTIPSYADGEIGYLASGLNAGRIKIIGNAGHYVGALNGKFSEVEIVGNVGHNAGTLMSGDAQLIIHGNAGHNLGDKIKGKAFVQAETALSIGEQPAVSDEIHVQARIRAS